MEENLMPAKSYKFVYDEYGNTKEVKVHTRGVGVHGNNYVNKGTAFTETERRDLGLDGSLPPAVRPLQQQVKNSLVKVFKKEMTLNVTSIYVHSLTGMQPWHMPLLRLISLVFWK